MRRIVILMMFVLFVSLVSAQAPPQLSFEEPVLVGNLYQITLNADIDDYIADQLSVFGGKSCSDWEANWQFYYGTDGNPPTNLISSCNDRTTSSATDNTFSSCTYTIGASTITNPQSARVQIDYLSDPPNEQDDPSCESFSDTAITDISFDICEGAGCPTNCRDDDDCASGETCEGYTVSQSGQCWVRHSYIVNEPTSSPPQSCSSDANCPADEIIQECGTGFIRICFPNSYDYYCAQIPTEVLGTCEAGIVETCPDTVCDVTEDCSTCAADCGCSDPNPFCDNSNPPAVCAPCPPGEFCQKRSINDTIEGNCPVHTQCYYGLNSGFPDDCVDDDYFDISISDEEDKYCFDGRWSTRTRIVAEKLLDIANNEGGDFSIFCDDKNKSLIFGDSDFGDFDDGQPTGDHEKYCVLLLGDAENVDGIVVGAAVYDINDYLIDLGEAFGAAHDQGTLSVAGHTCNSALDFEECFSDTSDPDPRKHLYVYANSSHNLVLFTQDSSAVAGFWVDGIANFFEDILSIDAETARLTTFDRLYISKKTNGDSVTAVYQTLYSDSDAKYDRYLTVEYDSLGGVVNDLRDSIPAEEVNVVSGNILIYKNPNPGAWNLLSGRTRLS